MAGKAKNYLDFLRIVGKSKQIPRTGWVRENVRNPESIAEHSFRVGVLAMTLADDLKVNKEKLMKMSLVHDLGETLTGDIVWTRGELVDIRIRENKEKEELKNLVKLFTMLEKGGDYINIFQEMLSGFSKEAQIFWQIDKLEMALQAFEYEQEQGINLEEFFMNTALFIKHSILKEIFKEIVKGREIRDKFQKI